MLVLSILELLSNSAGGRLDSLEDVESLFVLVLITHVVVGRRKLGKCRLKARSGGSDNFTEW